MKPQQVVDHYGSVRRTAAELGITRAAVQKWVKKGRVPADRQLMIEEMTSRKLRAD